MVEVRRSEDDELCGSVREENGTWHALAVFGGNLGSFDSEEAATSHVLHHGLASLADRWWFRRGSDAEWQQVCIQEAGPHMVRVALGYYSLPGTPTEVIRRQELGASVEMRHGSVDP